jgi:hypothetical protein
MPTIITFLNFLVILLNNSHLIRSANNDFDLAAIATNNFFTDINNENWGLKTSIHCNETLIPLQEGKIMSTHAHKNYDLIMRWLLTRKLLITFQQR